MMCTYIYIYIYIYIIYIYIYRFIRCVLWVLHRISCPTLGHSKTVGDSY